MKGSELDRTERLYPSWSRASEEGESLGEEKRERREEKRERREPKERRCFHTQYCNISKCTNLPAIFTLNIFLQIGSKLCTRAVTTRRDACINSVRHWAGPCDLLCSADSVQSIVHISTPHAVEHHCPQRLTVHRPFLRGEG